LRGAVGQDGWVGRLRGSVCPGADGGAHPGSAERVGERMRVGGCAGRLRGIGWTGAVARGGLGRWLGGRFRGRFGQAG
jgi:hypothetical protein